MWELEDTRYARVVCFNARVHLCLVWIQEMEKSRDGAAV